MTLDTVGRDGAYEPDRHISHLPRDGAATACTATDGTDRQYLFAAAFLGSTTGHAPYDASKGGSDLVHHVVGREVAALGIAVNAVAPGMIRTDMTAATLANAGKNTRSHPAGSHRRAQRDCRCRRLPGIRASQLHDRHHRQRQRRTADAVSVGRAV